MLEESIGIAVVKALEGEAAPLFCLTSTAGEFCLESKIKQGLVLIIFYTNDFTPSCKRVLGVFTEEFSRLKSMGVELVGVSREDIDSHIEFANECDIPFPLASDTDLSVISAYGVLDDDGVAAHRSVFCVSKSGTILHANRFFQSGNVEQLIELFQIVEEASAND